MNCEGTGTNHHYVDGQCEWCGYVQAFSDDIKDGALANDILDVIFDFEWNPPLNNWDAVHALALVMEHLTGWYDPQDEFEELRSIAK